MTRLKGKMGKAKVTRYTKTKRVSAKIPKELWARVKPLKEKYQLKSNQEIFDYLIVSGVVYLNRPVIEIINDGLGYYIERRKKLQLARLGKCEAPEMPETHFTNFLLYPKDLEAFNKFCVEKNCAKQWVFEILFNAFAEEREEIISLVTKNRDLNVRSRKKQIARLAEDEWVGILPSEDQKAILERLTESYEERRFDKSLQGEIDYLLREKEIKLNEEQRLEAELDKKIKAMRQRRTRAASALAKPILDGDEDA